jgi:hypothetical protein
MFTYSWHWADSKLAGRDTRLVARNTRLVRHEDHIGLRLHDTEVVKYHRNGDVSLDSGGWLTPVTKERMHRFTDAFVGSTKGRWHVTWGSRTVPFANGMVLHPDGSVSGIPSDEEVAAQDAANKAARDDIARFLKGITPARIVAAFDNMGGDCILCRVGDTSCLALHVEEDYLHGTLMMRALEAKGFNVSVMSGYIYHEAERGRIDRALTDSLRRYLTRAMVQAVAVK